MTAAIEARSTSVAVSDRYMGAAPAMCGVRARRRARPPPGGLCGLPEERTV
jgi:hypothetical protein